MSRVPPLLLAALALCACGPRELHVTMKPDNNSGQSGFAVVTEGPGGKVHVVIETSAPMPAVGAQPTHIHADSTCGEVGSVKFPLPAVTPLTTPDKEGRAGSTGDAMDLTFKQLLQGGYIINIHHPQDTSVYMSCGEIPVQ